MKKYVRLMAFLAACAMLLTFSACRGKETEITVKNELGYDLEELYISASNAEKWGAEQTKGVLGDGKSVSLLMSTLFDSKEAVADILAIDVDGDAYEFRGIELCDGCTVRLVWESEDPEAIVTPSKGDSVIYGGGISMGAGEMRQATMEEFLGCWKYDAFDAYIALYEDMTWQMIDGGGNILMNPEYALSEDGVDLFDDSGEFYIALSFGDTGWLTDSDGDTLSPSVWPPAESLLPSSEDPLAKSIALPGFPEFEVWYPELMEGHLKDGTDRVLSFNAINEEGTEDFHTNITAMLLKIDGYDPYMERGYDTAQEYMQHMLETGVQSAYGDKIIQYIGTDFEDGGWYWGITGYAWVDGSVFQSPIDTPVRGVFYLRYVGPTGYAVLVSALGVQSRIENYAGIAENMLESIAYGGNWSTAPKTIPASGGAGGAWSDTGDYGDTYYWYDSDGDVWYWNGYEDVFIGYGDDYYIDDGQYYESDGWGWDYGDYYYDYEYYENYDPWSDPGDTWDW